MLRAGLRRLFYMLETKIFPSIVRGVGLGVAMLAFLSASGCSRDPLAPDCFAPDPEGSGCLIPNPGGTDVNSSCAEGDGVPPAGAVGADYYYDLSATAVGGTGNYTDWTATTTLPPGLTLDAATGEITGVPEGPGNMAYPLQVTVQDAVTGETYELTCADIVINERLNSFGVRTELNHCIPHTSSKEEMVALLQGGDGTEITCNALNPGTLPCPLGDGNGRPPPGITFNESSCTHSGSLTGDRRGTWVWMVEVEQSGYKTRVPFCAANDVDTFHDITLTANAVQESDLEPGLLEYDPSLSLLFGDGSYVWDIEDPACNADMTQCNSFGFRFDVTCSPFDPPFVLNGQHIDTGMTHEMTAQGPTPSASFATRPFVASFEMAYCTSANGATCDVDDPNFEQNAQTKYHFDVIGYPVVNNP
jgi:hypothetical protein